MEIHWFADACIAALMLLAAKAVSAYSRPALKGTNSQMRQSRLHAALENSRTGAWVWEISGRHFFGDTRACQNLGARPGALLGIDDFLACVAPSDRARVELEMERASISTKPFELVAQIHKPGAPECYVELTGRLETDDLGAPLRITGALRDVTQERRRNLELRRQAQILSQVHDAIMATTLDGRILSWNPGAERIYGYEKVEVMGREMKMLWFEEDRAGLEGQLGAVALASDVHEFVARVRHKSGFELYAHIRLALMRDADGAPVGLLACSHDVTGQREEHELLTLQANALESIDDAVLVTNRLETIVHSNAAATALFARPGQDLVGVPMSSLLAGGVAGSANRLAEIKFGLPHEAKWSGELVCWRAEGAEPIVTRASASLLELASGPSWVWVLRDITEQRRAEAALREREKRFRQMADSAPMMVWMTNARGGCEYVNKAWLTHAGMTRAEAEGLGWQDAIHPGDRDELKRLIECGPQGRQPFEIELRMLGSGGRISYTLTHGAPRREAGAVVGYIGSAVDISNIKKAEEERIQLEQQAQRSQKLHSLGVLAGGIAHDFNNMLVSILGFSDLALRELEPRHPARELVEQIELGSRRAAALVDQMLTFAGKARRANQEVDINQAVLEMVHLLERSIGDQIELDLQLDPNLAMFAGDPGQIRQVVMNLVINASDALEVGGGRIRICTGLHKPAPGQTERSADGEEIHVGLCVKLEVHDDGCGMGEDTLAQIFDPFYTTKFTGRGLGLSAVMGVVRSHGGVIQVNSRLGEGTTFRVLFPLTPAPSAGVGERRLAPESEPCVLAIDDDLSVSEATRQMLQSGGIKVFCANTEAQALEIFEAHSNRILLVLLDVVMPHSTPDQIAAGLAKIRGDVQILLTSGFSPSTRRPAVDGCTVVGFLPKPYTRDELLEAVATACPTIVRDLAADSAAS